MGVGDAVFSMWEGERMLVCTVGKLGAVVPWGWGRMPVYFIEGVGGGGRVLFVPCGRGCLVFHGGGRVLFVP